LAKYLFIFKVWFASVAVAWITISLSFVIHTSPVAKNFHSGQSMLCAFVHHIGCEIKANTPHSIAHTKINILTIHFG
jgi:hypothetical protein